MVDSEQTSHIVVVFVSIVTFEYVGLVNAGWEYSGFKLLRSYFEFQGIRDF